MECSLGDIVNFYNAWLLRTRESIGTEEIKIQRILKE